LLGTTDFLSYGPKVLPLVWCGNLERVCQLRCDPRYLPGVQNYEISLKIALAASKWDINISKPEELSSTIKIKLPTLPQGHHGL
ncbi:hypothetical protein AVEN_100293-1, partial [Araneus ventricosus]